MKQILVDDSTYEAAEMLARSHHMALGEFVKSLVEDKLKPLPKAPDIIGYFKDTPEVVDQIMEDVRRDRMWPAP